MVVAHVFHTSTWEAEAMQVAFCELEANLVEFEASLFYIVCF